MPATTTQGSTEDNEVKRVVATRPNAKAYYVSASGGQAVERVLEPEMIE